MAEEEVWDFDGEISPELIRCILCLQLPVSTPEELISARLLECCHTICKKCMITWDQEPDTVKTCPVCRFSIERNYYHNTVIEEMVEFPCDRCEMHPDKFADSWCEECKCAVCDECVISHRQLKYTKDHVIRRTDNGFKAGSSSELGRTHRCPIHNSEMLSIYCTPCDTLTCRDCQLHEHQEHPYKFVKDLKNSRAKDLIEIVGKLDYHLTLIEKGISHIEKREEKIKSDKATALDIIQKNKERIIELVDKRFNDLTQQVYDFEAAEIKKFEDHKNQLDLYVPLIQHSIRFINNLTSNGSEYSIVQMHALVQCHVKKMYDQIITPIYNPNYSPVIHYVQSGFEELTKAVNCVGQIVQSYAEIRDPNDLVTDFMGKFESYFRKNLTAVGMTPGVSQTSPETSFTILVKENGQSTNPIAPRLNGESAPSTSSQSITQPVPTFTQPAPSNTTSLAVSDQSPLLKSRIMQPQIHVANLSNVTESRTTEGLGAQTGEARATWHIPQDSSAAPNTNPSLTGTNENTGHLINEFLSNYPSADSETSGIQRAIEYPSESYQSLVAVVPATPSTTVETGVRTVALFSPTTPSSTELVTTHTGAAVNCNPTVPQEAPPLRAPLALGYQTYSNRPPPPSYTVQNQPRAYYPAVYAGNYYGTDQVQFVRPQQQATIPASVNTNVILRSQTPQGPRQTTYVLGQYPNPRASTQPSVQFRHPVQPRR